MTPEGKVKKRLKERIEALGGEVRAIRYIGRSHCPDNLVLFPAGSQGAERRGAGLFGWNAQVETKAQGKRPRPGQVREHRRLRDAGVIVLVCATEEQVDIEFPPP